MAKTSASFTLMDYTDGISLITGIDSNLPLTSQYDTTNQRLNPSWAGSTSLQLTPNVIKAGSSTNLVSSMTGKKWQRRLAGGEWTDVTSGSNGETVNSTTGVLTVSQDKLTGTNNQVEYKFSGNYLDPILNLTFPVEIKVTFSRVMNGTAFVVARAYSVDGSQFKNNQPSSLKIKAELIRGSESDTTNLSYLWYKSVNGTDWTALTSSVTGYNTSELSVAPSLVDSFAMFRCTITDTDQNSDTYNQKFTTEGVYILDLTEQYKAVIESTAGTFFKNNSGSTTLICKVYQNGVEVDVTGSSLTYTWTKTKADGTADSTFSPTGVAYGSIVASKKKAISISHDQVDVKATFFCSVS